MRIMVTGSGGMLGQAILRSGESGNNIMLPVPHELADVRDYMVMKDMLRRDRPDILINCAGVTHHRSSNDSNYYDVNSVAPIKISYLCYRDDVHMVHISTDCVFNGIKGAPYYENSQEFTKEIYGKSKLVGELDENHLTIRCSFVGVDGGLLKWLLDQDGKVPGYINARWNGMAVNKVADEIIYQATIETKGILHIFGQDTTKYDLLCDANEVFGLGLEIIPVEEPRIDRRLRTNRKEFTMTLPPIREQLEKML